MRFFPRLGAAIFAAVIMILLSLALSQPSTAADVLVLTERYPPYSLQDETGLVTGDATKMVRQVMDEAGLDYDIKLVLWNRAFQLTTSQDNVLIFSLVRTAEREANFHWLMPLIEANVYLYGRAEETRTVTRAAMQRGEFTAVCTMGDYACQTMRNLGIPEQSILAMADAQEVEAKVVASGRADLFIAQPVHVTALGAHEPAFAGRFKPLFKMPETDHFYLAAGSKVRPDIAAKITAAYQRLSAKGLIKTIEVAD